MLSGILAAAGARGIEGCAKSGAVCARETAVEIPVLSIVDTLTSGSVIGGERVK